MNKFKLILIFLILSATGCKKEGCTDSLANNFNEKAKIDDGSCNYDPTFEIPSTYHFLDYLGNSTVDYAGQEDRLNQLVEMTNYMKNGTSQAINYQVLSDMFSNSNGNGNGSFSFSSTKQLKDKCFEIDQALFENWMEDLSISSVNYDSIAINGRSGVLSSGSNTYLFNQNGIEVLQLVEKGLMGSVFMYQALNVYFGLEKMNVDNSTPVDQANNQHYTQMEHHFDEAFGYFGVDPSFPSLIPQNFWGKYCNIQNDILNSNEDMMSNFLLGRAAIANSEMLYRDQAILNIRKEWEEICAHQAIDYLNQAISYFGNDQGMCLHTLSEAYIFSWNLRYLPVETKRITNAEHVEIMNMFPTNFWEVTIADINNIKSLISSHYGI